MKTKVLKICLALGSAIVTGVTAFAETMVWVNNTSTTADWRTAGNWRTESGEAVATWPGENDTALFTNNPSGFWTAQTISYDPKFYGAGRTDVTIGTIEDTPSNSRRIIRADPYSDRTDSGINLTLLNPDLFKGYWSSSAGSVGLILPTTAGRSPKLSSVSCANRIDITVAEGSASLGSVYQSGTLDKRGGGELTVGATTGHGTRIHVTAGDLTLMGREKVQDGGKDDLPVKGAYVHLDANRIETMDFQDGYGNTRQVLTWRDVRGEGHPYAFFDKSYNNNPPQAYIQRIEAPFLNDTFAAGRTVVDYGSSNDMTHPTNCCLSFSERMENVREFFLVCATAPGGGGLASVLGDTRDIKVDFHRSGRKIGDPTYCRKTLDGDTLHNGQPDFYGDVWLDTLGVVSCGADGNLTVGGMANDRFYKGRVGNWKIGELVLFTNVLSRAERVQLHQYLRSKWNLLDTPEVVDAGAVTVLSASSKVSVPEGRSAFVETITAGGGTLVKDGGGELKVGSVVSAAQDGKADVEVRGGSIRFGGLAAVSDAAPATGAWLWLDADHADFETTTHADYAGKTLVSKWYDVRSEQRDRYAELPTGETDFGNWLGYPVVNAAACNGRTTVDFGVPGQQKSQAYLRIVGASGNTVREGFIVTAANSAAGAKMNVFGTVSGRQFPKPGTNYNSANDQDKRLLDLNRAGLDVTKNGVWTFNGAVIDPVAVGESVRETGVYNVISFAAEALVDIGYLPNKNSVAANASDTLPYGVWGGLSVGEVILYDRELTADERRQTSAYLMKKWRGQTSADVGGVKLGRLSFARGVDSVVDNETPVEAETIEQTGTAVVKRGNGAFTYPPALSEAGITEVTVEGGTFKAVTEPVRAILAKSVAHFDATDVSKMTYYVTDEGNGVLQTNLTKVLDQRSGNYLKPWIDTQNANRTASTNPVLRTVTTAEGTSRPVFDFGKLVWHTGGQSGDCAAFEMNAKCTTVREAHTIFSDTLTYAGNPAHHMDIFSANDYSMHYSRSGDGCLLASASAKQATGSFAIDGAWMSGETAMATPLGTGFHLVSTVQDHDTEVASMACTHGVTAGGCQIGELIMFSEQLADWESEYLQNYLMAKWLGAEAPSWPTTLDRLTVAAGATFDVGVGALSVGSLVCEGSITARSLALGTALTVSLESPLVFSGRLQQSGAIELTVLGLDRKTPAGDYPIVTAGDLEGIDLSVWQVANEPDNRSVLLRRVGNSIVLRVMKRGLLIQVR